MDSSSSSSRTTSNLLSRRLESLLSSQTHTDLQGATMLRARALALPRQPHYSSSRMPPAPLLRYSSHSRSFSDATNTTDEPSPSTSSPPSPMLTALHEALSESILLSPPPAARISSSFSVSHALSRPSPLLSAARSTRPTASLSAAHDPPLLVSPTTPDPSLTSARVSSIRSPPPRSSIETLRSIYTSAPTQPAPSQSLARWWFQSDSDPERTESASAVLDDEDIEEGGAGFRNKFRAPKAPLVFCHGLLGFDSVTIGPAIAPLQVSHWRGIKEVLEASGCEVLITRVPATSSPVDRAKVLEKRISETYPGRGVHLIGHSMGGLDCRYLTTHLTQRTFRVLSLTTIATPHHGSSFASHFLTLASSHLPAVLSLLDLLPNGGGDGKAFECLTREAVEEFNRTTPDAKDVRYFSWGAEYEPGLIDAWKYPHSIIFAQEGPNDGLVSVQSARWGTYLGTLRNVNHLDLVGWTGGITGGLTGSLLNGAGTGKSKGMRAWVRGKEVGFSAGRFYSGVADLLAGVEEEEGYVVDGVWVGWEGKHGRKAKVAREGMGKPVAPLQGMGEREAATVGEEKEGRGVPGMGGEGLRRTLSDQERMRMEEILDRALSPSTSPPSPSSPSDEDHAGNRRLPECKPSPVRDHEYKGLRVDATDERQATQGTAEMHLPPMPTTPNDEQSRGGEIDPPSSTSRPNSRH
ncbi:alpha beta-hydrolase [Phlebopus sp. FC_14]|nr:alpha beta-hydrolase [Phlebopus sp. FC_14]